MSYDPSKIAFIDTETTGLHPTDHPIWEIAVIVDNVEHVWQQMVPVTYIKRADQMALRMNGWFDRYDPETALSGGESVRRFADLVACRHLVGCNPAFDATRLELAFRTWWGLNPTWHYRMRDINSMMHGHLAHGYAYHGYWPEPPFSSTEMSKQLGIDPEQFEPKHTALADCRWAKAVYETIVGSPKEPT